MADQTSLDLLANIVMQTTKDPSAPKSRVKPKAFTTKSGELVYDSTKSYIQMGSAARASEISRQALRRIAIILDDVDVSRRKQAEGVITRIQSTLKDLMELELMVTRFEQLKTSEVAQLLSQAFGEAQASMGWYRKMLEAHVEEDRIALTPLFEELKGVVARLGKVREEKILAALKMEEQFAKSRHSYLSEANKPLGKGKKTANKTKPVVHENQPYPVNSVTPQVALDPKVLIEQAAKAIKAREKVKTAQKQAEKTEKEAESE